MPRASFSTSKGLPVQVDVSITVRPQTKGVSSVTVVHGAAGGGLLRRRGSTSVTKLQHHRITRLRYAVARGARVLKLGEWNAVLRSFTMTPIAHVPTVDVQDNLTLAKYRIHPRDRHLQYGAISRAMINRVVFDMESIDGDVFSWTDSTRSRAAMWFMKDCQHKFKAEDLEAFVGMYLLFMAEVLADRGL